jgi:hypothetical protein
VAEDDPAAAATMELRVSWLRFAGLGFIAAPVTETSRRRRVSVTS